VKVFAFRQGDRRLLGVLDGAVARNLSAAFESAGVVESEHDLLRGDHLRPQRLTAFLKRWRRFAPKLEGPIEYDVPVKPGKILLVGRNFAAHAKELGNAVDEELLFFAKLPESLVAHGGAVKIPAHVKRADHEAELGVVIARDGAHIPEVKAFSYVAGYTCVLDVTARDQQLADKEKQWPWLRSKSYDTFCPMGPYFVPIDDVLDPNALEITCRVNGAVRQAGNTRDWIHKIPKVIATISRHTTLRAGDVISMGTPSGVGSLTPGDEVELEIQGVGTLRCSVAAAEARASVDKAAAFAALRPRLDEAISTARDGGEAFERAVALLDTLPHFHWTGVYRVEPDGSLGLGPFR
jgi:2-keto-4-pentenoate hydratase/2-oxohepta-3-ene-1,7-dioic acid hydratase in catechol pathway